METRRSHRGFTLIELTISILVTTILILAMMNAFTSQSKTHEVVSGISEAQQTINMATLLLERDLRNAGYMVAAQAAVCGTDSTTSTDTLFVSDSAAIDSLANIAALESGPNSYIISAAAGGDGIGVAVINEPSPNTYELAVLTLDQDAAYDNNGTNPLTPDSDFQRITFASGGASIAGGVIARDTTDDSKGVACGVIVSVDEATKRIEIDWYETIAAPAAPSDLLFVPAHVYEVVPATSTTPAQLMRNGLAIASHVEDFQVAYFFDIDDDGLIDSGEQRGQLGGTAYDNTEGTVIDMLREVTVAISITTPVEGQEGQVLASRPQDLLNHTITAPIPIDNFKRRIVTTSVFPRNLGSEQAGG